MWYFPPCIHSVRRTYFGNFKRSLWQDGPSYIKNTTSYIDFWDLRSNLVTSLIFKNEKGDLMRSPSYLYVASPNCFRFLCGPCHIKGKRSISSLFFLSYNETSYMFLRIYELNSLFFSSLASYFAAFLIIPLFLLLYFWYRLFMFTTLSVP
jgi:hypothetical protein